MPVSRSSAASGRVRDDDRDGGRTAGGPRRDGRGIAAARGVHVEAVTLGGRAAERITPRRRTRLGGAVPARRWLLQRFPGQPPSAGRTDRPGLVQHGGGPRLPAGPEDPFPAAVIDAPRPIGPGGLRSRPRPHGGRRRFGRWGTDRAALLALRADGTRSPLRGLPLPVGRSDPVVRDLRLAGRSGPHGVPSRTRRDGPVLSRDDRPRTELASPRFAEDLSGLPPVLIEVGAHEVLLDDAIGLAAGLRAAGGSVTLTVWPELIHVFQAFRERSSPSRTRASPPSARSWPAPRGRPGGARLLTPYTDRPHPDRRQGPPQTIQ